MDHQKTILEYTKTGRTENLKQPVCIRGGYVILTSFLSDDIAIIPIVTRGSREKFMISIGALSQKTHVKIATIRYYEQIGLITPLERTEGNQRRYNGANIDRLAFIKHARALGFSIEAIKALITLQEHSDRTCGEAREISQTHLLEVRRKIDRLERLERELLRITNGCDENGPTDDCYILTSLADHSLCTTEHDNANN